MNSAPDPYLLEPATIVEFLSETKPFDRLPPEVLEDIARKCEVEFYPAGTMILSRNQSRITHLGLIYHGRVKLFLRDERGDLAMESYRGSGEAIGFLGILLGSLSNLDVVAERDTTCLLIEGERFRSLVRSNPHFAEFYLKAMAEGYVTKALGQLERPRLEFATEGTLYMFTAQVGDVVRRRPVTIPGSRSVQEAARMMSQRRVGCLLVTDSAGQIVGIVTDRDLRTKVVARGESPSLPVEKIMSSPVQTIPAHTYCFDALLEMMNHRLHHLVLEKDGDIVGVLSGHDLMVLQGTSPLFLVREILNQDRIEGLYDLSLKSPRVVSSLIKQGAKAHHVTRLITMVNDYILDRLLTLLQEEMGKPPLPFCWLLMGSEGRQEQTFRTDQDNGIIYADPQDQKQAKEARDYFKMLGNEAIRHLVACGFPRCPGNIMASNPQWCQPYTVWQSYFDTWIRTPEPQDVLNATIFFDFRAGYGATELGERLRTHLLEEVKGQDLFLRFLAKDALTTAPATSFFRGFVLEKSGKHKNKLDLKHKGLVPVVDFARIMALRSGVRQTNTMRRLQRLGEGGFIRRELYEKATQSYEFQMHLRLVHQQRQHDQGLEPDNYIDPADLSELERRTLKEALAITGDLKSFLREEFRLGSA